MKIKRKTIEEAVRNSLRNEEIERVVQYSAFGQIVGVVNELIEVLEETQVKDLSKQERVDLIDYIKKHLLPNIKKFNLYK